MGRLDNATQTYNKQVMKVYAAKSYKDLPWRQNCQTGELPPVIKILVNIPEYAPTVPQDDSYEQLGLSGSFFENQNFPSTAGTVKMNHCLSLPLLRGSRNPPDIPYGTPLLLLMPTNKIEEGYLIYI